MQNSKKILVATIGAAHSISGEVRVNSYCDPKEQLTKYSPLTDENGNIFVIQKSRLQSNVLICKFKDTTTRNQAESLNGKKLFILRSQLEEIGDSEEFYIEDLIGLDVVDKDSTKIGIVVQVLNYGAGDIVEVEFLDKKRELLPFTKELFPAIDLQNSKILYINASNSTQLTKF